MARGHRLNTSTVLEEVHGLSGLFRAVSASNLHSFVLPPPPSLICHLASVDVKQNGPPVLEKQQLKTHSVSETATEKSATKPLIMMWGLNVRRCRADLLEQTRCHGSLLVTMERLANTGTGQRGGTLLLP